MTPTQYQQKKSHLLKVNPIPRSSGVYLMKNQFNEIIYIGKAKNLSTRVKSYFRKNPPPRTQRLLQELHSIEYQCTDSELEALLLESKLIKLHLPRYNRQIRHYKNYPFMKISLDNEFPRVYVTKQVLNDGHFYFGPFNSSYSLTEQIALINKIFGTRICSKNIKVDPGKSPCLYGQIKQCSAPCSGHTKKSGYRKLVTALVNFLESGDADQVFSFINKKTMLLKKMSGDQSGKVQGDILLAHKILNQYKLLREAIHFSSSILLSKHDEQLKAFTLHHGTLKDSQTISSINELTTFLQQSINNIEGQARDYLFPDSKSLYQCETVLRKEDLDEMKIIAQWIKSHQNETISFAYNKISSFLRLVKKEIKERRIHSLSQIFDPSFKSLMD